MAERMKPEAMHDTLRLLRDIITSIDDLIDDLKVHVLDSSTSIFGLVQDAVNAIADEALTEIHSVTFVNITAWVDAYALELKNARDTVHSLMQDETFMVNQALELMRILLDYEEPTVEIYWVFLDMLDRSYYRIQWVNLKLEGFTKRYNFAAKLDEALFAEEIDQLRLPKRLVISRKPKACDKTFRDVLKFNRELEETVGEVYYIMMNEVKDIPEDEKDTIVTSVPVLVADSIDTILFYMNNYKNLMEKHSRNVLICMTEYDQKLTTISRWLQDLSLPFSDKNDIFDTEAELKPFITARNWYQYIYDAYLANDMNKFQIAHLFKNSTRNDAILALDSLQSAMQRKGMTLLSEDLTTIQQGLVTYYTEGIDHVMDLADYFAHQGAQVSDSIKHLSIWRGPLPNRMRVNANTDSQTIVYQLSEEEALSNFENIDMGLYTERQAREDIIYLVDEYLAFLFDALDAVDSNLIATQADLESKILRLDDLLRNFGVLAEFGKTSVTYVLIMLKQLDPCHKYGECTCF